MRVWCITVQSFVTYTFLNLAKETTAFSNYGCTCKRNNLSRKTQIRRLCSTNSAITETLSQYLFNLPSADEEISNAVIAIADSCIEISGLLAVLPLTCEDDVLETVANGGVNVQGEKQKGMDIISNNIFKENLRPHAAALASEEEDSIILGSSGKSYEIAFDPLDGSSNLSVNIPTGSIFGIGIHEGSNETPFSRSGRSLKAAGYALYSSSTEFVLSFGEETVGFTLDRERSCFIKSRNSISCPERGTFYSLNDGREPDWPKGLQRWIYDAKRGLTPSGTIYSSRYVCSLVADFHRTLLVGGWAGNPRPHLRLLYEAAPLAFLAEAAGGYGSDGEQNILDIVPSGLHGRVCVFLGSRKDIEDMEGYGDIQQCSKKYDS